MAESNMMVDPYQMDPPKGGVIWMNDKGTVIMSRDTLAEIAQGKIPLKFNKTLDLEEKQEILTIEFGNDEEQEED